MNSSQLKSEFLEAIQTAYTPNESAELWLIFAEKILKKNRVELRTPFDVSSEQRDHFRNAAAALITGKPYQQILGEAYFYGLQFYVNDKVLIPRPETEELVEIVIQHLKNSKPVQRNLRILDIGTGSGVIPVVLKKHFPNAAVAALDFSEEALEVARKNAAHHRTEIDFLHLNYLEATLAEKYDLIVSNPPYIGQDEINDIARSVRDFEPDMALFSPTADALIFYRKIAADSLKNLNAGGKIFLEINQKLGKETLNLFGNYPKKELLKDLSGNDRFIVASL